MSYIIIHLRRLFRHRNSSFLPEGAPSEETDRLNGIQAEKGKKLRFPNSYNVTEFLKMFLFFKSFPFFLK